MLKIILITWLTAIHAFALLAICDTDLLYRIDRKLDLGLLHPAEITHLYEDMLGSHLQLDGSVEPGSVVFLGDSLTQALNVAAISNHAINYGIGMDTSFGLLQRIPKYKSLNKASIIVIAIGINDLIRIGRSPVAVLKYYEKILDSLPPEANVVVQAIFPVDERVGLTGVNAKITRLNAMLQPLAERRMHHFVTLENVFANPGGQLKTAFHVGDGLHLSDAAYKRWIEALSHYISMTID